MKKLPVILFFLLSYSFCFSQASELLIKRGPKGYYLEHSVAAHEGLFPIGRIYNVHPRHIANFNGLDFNKGLSIGQRLNIPLSDTNFRQDVNKGVPVYYKTATKETMANISLKNNSVSIGKIRSWNNLTADNVPAGTELVVGFLITNEMQDRVVTLVNEEESVSNVKKQEAAKKDQAVPDVSNVVTENKNAESTAVKEEPKKTEPEIKKEEPPLVKEESKKDQPVIVKQIEKISEEGTGYFKNNFYQQVKSSPAVYEQTVTSSIFKTTSGWQDSKYYLLINGVEPGTIVKITNPTNNKIIFAKVLYAMDKVRENQGVDIRISDAAAASLAVTETDKFILKVNY